MRVRQKEVCWQILLPFSHSSLWVLKTLQGLSMRILCSYIIAFCLLLSKQVSGSPQILKTHTVNLWTIQKSTKMKVRVPDIQSPLLILGNQSCSHSSRCVFLYSNFPVQQRYVWTALPSLDPALLYVLLTCIFIRGSYSAERNSENIAADWKSNRSWDPYYIYTLKMWSNSPGSPL